MAPLKRVKKLCELCQTDVKRTLLTIFENLRSRKSDDLAKTESTCHLLNEFFTENLPSSASTDILDTILSDSDLDTEIKFLAVLALIGPQSKKLKFALGFPEEYHERLLLHLEDTSTNIEIADFRGLWLQDDRLNRLCRNVLPKMSRLRQLALPHIANDAVLDSLGNHCPQLMSLDLYGSPGVSPNGLRKFSEKLGSKLQLVNLGGPVVLPMRPERVAEALPHLKELSSLGSYPFGGNAVTCAAEMHDVKRTKLKYIHDRYSTPETLTSLPGLCPNLTAIFLDTPEKGILKFLPKFSRLTRLKVSKIDCEDFHMALESLTPLEDLRLTVLEVVSARGSLDLYRVSTALPKLEVFEMYYSTSTHISMKENFVFPSLKKLVIYDTEISGAASEVLLGSCPEIGSLTLAHCEEISDEVFCQILSRNSMSKCHELNLLYAPLLTSETVRFIISCLDNIHYIGRLDNWNVGWTEVEEIRFEIRHFNLDVQLGEQFNNIDKFQAVEHQENPDVEFVDDVVEGLEDGDEVFFDVLLVPDDEDDAPNDDHVFYD